MATKSKFPEPDPLPRLTSWTAERIAKLNMVELRQLADNALRLGSPEIAAMCEEAMTVLRRQAAAARKAAPTKAKKPAKPKATPE